ncbi:MAG: hypothetical protein ACQETZ_09385 [Candidatus Fermentibacterota bacterium]
MAGLLIAALVLFPPAEDWTHHTCMTAVEDLLAGDGRAVCATSGGLVFVSLDADGMALDSSYSYPGKLSHSRVSGLAEDDGGNLWVCLYGGGIDLFHPDGTSESFGLLEGLPTKLEVNAVVPDTSVYAATTEGLSIRETGFFQNYTTTSTGGGLPSNVVLSLQPTPEGMMVGTDEGPALLAAGEFPGSASSWTSYPEAEDVEVRDMVLGADTLWAATSTGLLALPLSGGEWQQAPGFAVGSAYSVDAAGDTLAVGGGWAVHCRTAEGWSSDSSFPGEVVAAVELVDGAVLAGQYAVFSDDRAWGEGLALGWPGEGWSRYRPPGLPANDLESVSALPGIVWTGTDDNGAGYQASGEWTRVRSELSSGSQLFAVEAAPGAGYAAPYHHGLCWVEAGSGGGSVVVWWTGDDGLINDQVVDMARAGEGDVWLAQVPYFEGEESGAVHLDWSPGVEGSETWTRFTQVQGLPSSTVASIDVLPGAEGLAWAGTGGGAALLDLESGEVEDVLGVGQGLPSANVQRVACSTDGSVWLGTTAGLAVRGPQGTVEQVEEVGGSVEALCLDNLGRAWVATSQKLYLVDAGGSVEEISTFNSPLLSLNISALDCDTEQGLVYVATTDHGLWQIELPSGLQGDGSAPVLYPNPFLPADHGTVRVSGIPDETAEMRVFDLSGSLVYESEPVRRSLLGWDGSAGAGSAASGTYIVIVRQGGSSWLLKLALVR